jgi:hypothetical protein
LFRVRAGNVGGAEVHDDGTIVELCRRLDGLPLAIELAAACAGSLTVHDLLDGLDDRFTLLERSTRRGTARHRSLAAMVAWSYQLLDDDERRMFERVSVFSGRFDLAAAIPVAAIDGASPSRVRALLTSLVDKSMVTADVSGTRTRYRLLDTLRDYGVSRLAARHELDDARRGHLATFVELAERARREYDGCARGPGHEAFVDGWDDFRSAIEWAVADGDVAAADRLLRALFCFAFYGLRHELGRWAEHVLAVGPVDPLTAGIAAAFRSKQSDIRRARELAEIGLAASGSGRGDGAALCLFALADSCVHSGELAQTWSLARQGSAAVDDDGDPAVVTSAIAEAAYVGAMYDPPTADPFIDRLRSLAERIDDPGAAYCVEIATALQGLYGGSPEGAGTHALRAMEIADSMGAALHIAVARQVLAAWLMRTRRDDIDGTVADTLTYLYDVGDGGAWGILESVAIRWARLGRLDEAAVVLGYLERHALRYATNVVKGRRALARVQASPATAERLRYGESLDGEEVVRFALAALRRGADRSSSGGQSRQMSAPRAASRPTRSS